MRTTAVRYATVVTLLALLSVSVIAQDRQALIDSLKDAFSAALNEYDPNRQVRPAAIAILNANEHLTSALRNSIGESFEGVPDLLDDAEDALRDAARILEEVAAQGFFIESDAARLQEELFFVLRDEQPESMSEALKSLHEACLDSADDISLLLGGEGEVPMLREVINQVSSMRLVIATFYQVS